MIPAIFEKGRQEGKDVRDIKQDLQNIGFSYPTIMRHAPEWAKQPQKRKPTPKGSQMRTITSDIDQKSVTEPNIPPPPQPIQQVLSEPEPKPVQNQNYRGMADLVPFFEDLKMKMRGLDPRSYVLVMDFKNNRIIKTDLWGRRVAGFK